MEMTARRSPIRRLAVAAIAGGILLLLTLVAWRAWIPRYRPALRAGEAYGIDVSEHQGRVDWRAVAADGFEYAYVKATEGADHVDDDFSRNWTGAATAGITRGAYHFFSFCSAGD